MVLLLEVLFSGQVPIRVFMLLELLFLEQVPIRVLLLLEDQFSELLPILLFLLLEVQFSELLPVPGAQSLAANQSFKHRKALATYSANLSLLRLLSNSQVFLEAAPYLLPTPLRQSLPNRIKQCNQQILLTQEATSFHKTSLVPLLPLYHNNHL